jgi:hypothetical protein
MRRSGILAFAVLAAVLAGAGPAGAQRPVPVAGPLPSGAELVAFDRGGRLCLRLEGDPETGGSCAPPPRSVRHPNLATARAGDAPVLFGTVTADVATVDLRFADGQRVAAPTTPGAAYRGRHAGRVRFFLAEAPVEQQPFLIRLLDAGGRLIAASGQ